MWHFVRRDLWLCPWIREGENMNKSSYVSEGRIITENKGREERPRKGVVWTKVISTRRMAKLSQRTGVEEGNNVTPPFCLKNRKLIPCRQSDTLRNWGPIIQIPAGETIFLTSMASRVVIWPTQLLNEWVSLPFAPGLKWSRREAGDSPQCRS